MGWTSTKSSAIPSGWNLANLDGLRVTVGAERDCQRQSPVTLLSRWHAGHGASRNAVATRSFRSRCHWEFGRRNARGIARMPS